ncbi:uncharacterized protein DS421_7g207610 [Arachis hypogaea]|nr:uncharacterized protein DS421_7g207610 [Arachis hypogaea]
MPIRSRGLLEGGEERHGLLSMCSVRHRIRHWQKLCRMKQGRHMFWGLIVLLLMCFLLKFLLMHIFSHQLDVHRAIRSNIVQHKNSSHTHSVYIQLSFLFISIMCVSLPVLNCF